MRESIPKDWNAERDVQEYIRRFGESEDYYKHLIWHVAEAHSNVQEALLSAYDYLNTHDGPVPRYTECAEDVETMEEVMSRIDLLAPDSHPRVRLSEILGHCKRVFSDYEELLATWHREKRETVWMLSFVRVADELALAGKTLEGVMVEEYPDFDQPRFYDNDV